MRDGGRLSAAIEVLGEIEARHRPAKLALKGWGDANRFAGSKDRAFISGLVLDVLRKKRSLGWIMGDEGHRALVLGAVRFGWGWPLERITAAVEEQHGPGPLGAQEQAALESPRSLSEAPAAVRGDYPDWLDAQMARVFGEERAEEGAALAARAPVDLRVNLIKTDPERAAKVLEPLKAEPAAELPQAFRIAAPDPAERAGAVETIPAFGKGWFEVQDLGSQLAAAAAGEIKGKQVLDFCAGGGGKTLALAGAMGNTGQLYAYDNDARRMGDLIPRATRAGVRNLQVRSPVEKDPLRGLEGKMDVVFVDAPCTGSGTWRRHPDTKWRLSPEQLERRMAEQDKVLDEAAPQVKPGGRLVYVTCSVFAEENEDRLAGFVERRPEFALTGEPQRMSPRRTGTDGFFVAVLERAP
ncbi:MAG TPA: RsmB/NOP family class I SAM-dependent RNA methyltransferase [Caulobacteraceae bacterium]|nr:RsmB/NOP family class I SAM-dependent RNA methyltransferase [Caulobacteraceae bacterium]